MKNIIDKQQKAYQDSILKHGTNHLGLLWSDEITPQLRFERLLLQVKDDIQNATIHEVGCGLCDFHAFLKEQGINHSYSGTDIVQESIDFAQSKFPEITLYNRNFLETETEVYDFTFLSGMLNLKLDITTEDWNEFSMQMIRKMFQSSSKAISFNCLTSYNSFSREELMYFNPQVVYDYCVKHLSRFVVIDSSYPLFEFTVTVFQPSYVESKFSNDFYKKYFASYKQSQV